MKSLAVAVSVALFGGSLSCAHPHSGKPERLRMPAEKEPEKEEGSEDGGGEEAAADESCRTNFFADPHKGRRRSRDARRLAQKADGELLDAEQAGGSQRRARVVDAMTTLENSLKKDPYAPLPTYKYAVAYALVGRKACALAFLERLNELQRHPDVEREAYRTIQRALRDPAFEGFKKEAEAALGE